jgi:predicted RNase H-like HicB family nuclease
MARYVALVDGRSVLLPDLPGCTSAASTIDTHLPRAMEGHGIVGHRERIEHGRNLPAQAAGSEPSILK